MRALEILLERRWILKRGREKELYYQIKDELGTVKKILDGKAGVSGNRESLSCKSGKDAGDTGELDGNSRIYPENRICFFLYDFNVSGRKRSRRAICTFRADRIYTGAVQGGAD